MVADMIPEIGRRWGPDFCAVVLSALQGRRQACFRRLVASPAAALIVSNFLSLRDIARNVQFISSRPLLSGHRFLPVGRVSNPTSCPARSSDLSPSSRAERPCRRAKAISRSQCRPHWPAAQCRTCNNNIPAGNLFPRTETPRLALKWSRPHGGGRGNGGRDLLFGEERSHYTTHERHLHVKMS
jgi:hypothetical protein